MTDINMIIFHHTAGQIGAKETVKDWVNLGKAGERVSAHYIVERNDDGNGVAKYVQVIPLDLAAQHSGNFGRVINERSIGIEIVNWGKLRKVGDDYYPEDPRVNVLIDPGEVGAETPETEEGEVTYWQVYTPAQYRALQIIIMEINDYGIKIEPGSPPFFLPTLGPAIRGRSLWSKTTGRHPLKDLVDPNDYDRYKKYILNDYAGGWVGHSAVSKKSCPGPYLIWGKIRDGITNER